MQLDVYCGLFILHRKTIMSQITFPARITEVNCSYPNRENVSVLSSVLIGEFGVSYLNRGQEVIKLHIEPLSQHEIQSGINNTNNRITQFNRTIEMHQLDLEHEKLSDKKDIIRETIKQYEKHIQKYQEELDFFKKHIISE